MCRLECILLTRVECMCRLECILLTHVECMCRLECILLTHVECMCRLECILLTHVECMCRLECILLTHLLQVLLRSDKGVANFSDRTLLKNLGHWLGMITLGKNKPILKNVSALFCCHHHSTLYFLLCPSVGHCWQVCEDLSCLEAGTVIGLLHPTWSRLESSFLCCQEFHLPDLVHLIFFSLLSGINSSKT